MNATTNSTIPTVVGLVGPVQLWDLLNTLLDQPVDSEYKLTMEQGAPLTETTHSLKLASGEVLWSSSSSARSMVPLASEQIDLGKTLKGVQSGTIRSLIQDLVGFSSEDIIDLGGHLRSELTIRVYPSEPASWL